MINFKKHHWLGVGLVLLVLSWALWTFYYLPMAETPRGIPNANTAPAASH